MKRPIRVLVVDDSPTMADAVSSLLSEDPRIEVVGRANNGSRAITLARLLRPDVITMDLLMPDLDGPAAIAAIMAEAPARIVVVSAVADQRNLDVCFQAMSAGALELIGKPNSSSAEDLRRWGRQLADSVCLMAEVPVISRRVRPAATPTIVPGSRVDVFGIAASTGGPPALAEVLSRLPTDLPIPLLIAQHITEGFTPGMVRWLSQVTPLQVRIARHGEKLEPGYVYFPLDGHDMTVEGGGVAHLSRTRGGPCPSGDLLLGSLAHVYGGRAGGAVLTGMGEDGARGLLEIRKAGGVTLAQDEASSVVFGMPKAALDLKAADRGVPLSSVAEIIRASCKRAPTLPRSTPGGGGIGSS